MVEDSFEICSNPNCKKKFKEPILLTIHSVTPEIKYEACPYCFANLKGESSLEEDTSLDDTFEQNNVSKPNILQKEVIVEENSFNITENSILDKVKDSRPSLFKKVKNLIPTPKGSPKKNGEKTKLMTEPEDNKEKTLQEKSITKSSEEKEIRSSGCPEFYGYLANRSQDVPIPQECLVCKKMVDCMLSPRNQED